MTCIVGVQEAGNIYIGGDSAGVAGLSTTVRDDVKVFQNGPFIMGGTSSFRMIQLLHYRFDPPRQSSKQSDMQYMVTDFVDAVRECFSDGGFGSTGKHTDNEGGCFLIGYNKVLYCIQDDFQVAIPKLQYGAVGCGSDLALGSLFSSKGATPRNRIKLALEAATAFSGGVLPPYRYVEQVQKIEKKKVTKTTKGKI